MKMTFFERELRRDFLKLLDMLLMWMLCMPFNFFWLSTSWWSSRSGSKFGIFMYKDDSNDSKGQLHGVQVIRIDAKCF